MDEIAGGVIAAAGALLRPLDRDALFDVIRGIKGGNLTQGDVDRVNGVLDGLASGGVVPGLGHTRFERLLTHITGRAMDAKMRAIASGLAEHSARYGQDATPERLAEFVAQIANETGGFTRFEENLNYSAKRMREVWPSRVTAAQAAALAHNPEAIANVVYQRPKEGNTQPGDGWKYRGRGALQLTFRNNYRRYGQLLGLQLEEHPELAADPAVSVLIALEFFKQGKVNAAIDRGDFREARRITNGGSIGLEEVARLRRKALEVLR